MAADLAVHYEDQSDGFGRNLHNGREVNNIPVDLDIRSKWKFDLSDRTVVRLIVDYGHLDIGMAAYRPTYGSIPINGVPYTGAPFNINSDVQPLSDNKQGGASVTVDQDFGWSKLVSISAYRDTTNHFQVDNDKTPVFLNGTYVDTNQNQVSQEVHLLSEPGGPFQWLVGAYYFKADTHFVSEVTSSHALVHVPTYQTADSDAAFAQGTYKVAPKLDLTIGVRYTYEKRDFDGSQAVDSPAGATLAALPQVTGKLIFEKPTFRGALDYHITDEILGYVSYNRGFKSGGFNPTTVALPLDSYTGESLDAYELGLKADLLDHRLRVNTAAYYYNYSNIQVTAYTSGVSTIQNAASAKIYGLDMDVAAVPVRNLTVTAGLSLIHDRFGNFPNAVATDAAHAQWDDDTGRKHHCVGQRYREPTSRDAGVDD